MQESKKLWILLFIFIYLFIFESLNPNFKKENKEIVKENKEIVKENKEIVKENKEIVKENKEIVVKASAYTASKDETDEYPNITAFNTKPTENIIAVSYDLLSKHGWNEGDRIKIPGIGIRIIKDIMPKKHSKSIDIFFKSKKTAKKFGRKKIRVVNLDKKSKATKFN